MSDKRHLAHGEESLYRAVLAVLSVKHGEYAVYAQVRIGAVLFEGDKALVERVGAHHAGDVVGVLFPLARGDILDVADIAHPVSALGYAYANDLIFFLGYALDNVQRRYVRYIMLARLAAEYHRDLFSGHVP